jgi:hypothetical protein
MTIYAMERPGRGNGNYLIFKERRKLAGHMPEGTILQ